jgi:hypothetical protein
MRGGGRGGGGSFRATGAATASEVVFQAVIFRDCVLISGFTTTAFERSIRSVKRRWHCTQVMSNSNTEQSWWSGQCSVLWNSSMCSPDPHSSRNRRGMCSCSDAQAGATRGSITVELNQPTCTKSRRMFQDAGDRAQACCVLHRGCTQEHLACRKCRECTPSVASKPLVSLCSS